MHMCVSACVYCVCPYVLAVPQVYSLAEYKRMVQVLSRLFSNLFCFSKERIVPIPQSFTLL